MTMASRNAERVPCLGCDLLTNVDGRPGCARGAQYRLTPCILAAKPDPRRYRLRLDQRINGRPTGGD